MDTYETSIYYAVVISGIIIGAILVYFLFSLIKQKRQTMRFQRMYLLKEMNFLEEERKRVSRDMHDELGPLLTVVKGHINQLQPVNEEEELHHERANLSLLMVIRRMGQIAINLSPTALERKGLEFVVESFLEELQGSSRIRITFHCDTLPKIPTIKAIHIFRIVQEVCNNAVKHASCKLIEVQLKEIGSNICLLIRDDGKGFDKNEQAGSRLGQGLGSIKNRTDILRGRMVLDTRKNKGTEYFFEFPF